MTRTPTGPARSASIRTRASAIIVALAVAFVGIAASPANADVVGTGPGIISGTVTSTDGQPVEGVFVSVSTSWGQGTHFFASTTTDAAGHYEFAGLTVNAYDIQASAPGYQQATWQQAALSAAAPTATVNFVLLPFAVGVGTISGHVTGDGAPLADLSVSAYGVDSGQNVYTVTDENGFYEFTGLASGAWNIYASAGFQYQYLDSAIAHITESTPDATIDFPFVSWPVGTATISGLVTDSATGEALPGVSISAYGVTVPHSSSVTSDAVGAFSFDLLPEGTYVLNSWAFGYLSFSQEISVLADQTVTLNRALVATNATIRGHVEGPGGVPAAGLYVNAYTADGTFAGAVTDDNGDYVISNVGAVSYTLMVGGIGTPFNLKEHIVTAEANAEVTVDFTLVNRTTGYLTGMVFGPDGEFYSQPICATLYSSKNKKPLAQVATYGENYGDGTYAFDELKPGSYTVEFRDCDTDPATKFDKVFLGGVKNFKDATFVTIAAGLDSYENNVTLSFRGNLGH